MKHTLYQILHKHILNPGGSVSGFDPLRVIPKQITIYLLPHLPQKLYNLMFTQRLSFPAPLKLVFSFCDVVENLSGVEASSVA
jgi:hypothetical protein